MKIFLNFVIKNFCNFEKPVNFYPISAFHISYYVFLLLFYTIINNMAN